MEMDRKIIEEILEKPNPTAEEIETRLKLNAKLKSGAGWFYWVAALSVINSIIILANGEWSFLFGMGITQLVDGVVLGIFDGSVNTPASAKFIGLGLVVLISSIFALFGWQGNKRAKWAFLVGMVLYGLDALILLSVSDYLGIAFHFWVLFGLFAGYRACNELEKLDKAPAVSAPPDVPITPAEFSPSLDVYSDESTAVASIEETKDAIAPQKHSGFGIASFAFSLVSLLAFLGCFVFIVVMEAQSETGFDDSSTEAIFVGLAFMALAFGSLINLSLGVIGLFQQGKKKVFAILGTIFSLLVLLMALGLFLSA